MEGWPLRPPVALRPVAEASPVESRALSHLGGLITMLGLSWDALVPIALLVGWVVLMRFVLPRLSVST